VLGALFPKRLGSLRDCSRRAEEPATWVDVDDAQLENLEAGRFVAVVERRERVEADGAGSEVRYVVRIDNCQDNTSVLRVEATFSADALAVGSPAAWRRPRPRVVREVWGPR